MSELNAVTLGLFVLVVFPGLVSTTVYRLLMPARALEWGNAIVQGLFYSAINAVLAIPVLYVLVVGFDPVDHPFRYSIAAAMLLIVGPVAWPLVLVWVFRSKRLAQRIQIPYPTAWDYFFDKRRPGFVLFHLNNGALLGGYWGPNSYAGSYPNDGDIYVEAVYTVDDRGRFGAPVADSNGVLLRKEQYSYLELFKVPQETQDGSEQQQQRAASEG